MPRLSSRGLVMDAPLDQPDARFNVVLDSETVPVTDDLELTPEEVELEKAKEAAAVPPELIPDAEGLPDDVRDGEVVDDEGIPDADWPSPGYLTPEPDRIGPEHRTGE